jgi:hypothetical protein
MISIFPDFNFRKVPHQSGIYQLDLSILLDNHNHDVEFLLSGKGANFFNFGANSGNYYASGNSKLFFEATTPKIERNYSFVFSDSKYDVYNGSNVPLILGAQKPTGILERVYVKSQTGVSGLFEITLKGKRPSFTISSGFVIPIFESIATGIFGLNNSDVPFSILSGTLDTLNFISGNNKFPIEFNSLETKLIPFSGHVTSDNDFSSTLILNTDFGDFTNVLSISGTLFSGSGYQFIAPSAQTINFGDFSDLFFTINNTGTETITFQPLITPITRSISISTPTYSGVPIANFFTGYLDTSSELFFSDNISWTSGIFNIIQHNNTGVNILRVLPDKDPSLLTDAFIGTSGVFDSLAWGQSFRLTHNYPLTGISMRLGYNPSGSLFSGNDTASMYIRQGSGITGSLLSTSHPFNLNSLTAYPTTTGIQFVFPSPVELSSGAEYSFYLSGTSTWLGATPGRVLMIQDTTGAYITGITFRTLSDNSFQSFNETSGNLVFDIIWYPPSGMKRYFTNVNSGNTNLFSTVNSGSYNKYMADKSFVFSNTEIQSPPSTPKSFTMTYTGAVSGLNIVNLKFLGTNFDQNISGNTQ